jgi:L-lysine 2,3-aminomutase
MSTAKNWRWQLQHSVRTAEGLAKALRLSPELAVRRVAERRGLLPPYYLSLIDPDDPVPDPRQVVRTRTGMRGARDLRDPC